MNGYNDLAVLVSSLPHVAKVANAESRSAEIKRELFSPMLQKQARMNQERVQQVEPNQGAEPVDREGRQDQPRQEFHAREKEAETKEEKQETESSNPSPWAGNIVNVKI